MPKTKKRKQRGGAPALFSEEETRALHKRYKADKTLTMRTLAEELCVCRSTIGVAFNRYNLKAKPRSHRTTLLVNSPYNQPEIVRQIEWLYNGPYAFSTGEIAVKLNMHYGSAVLKVMERHGMKKRPRPMANALARRLRDHPPEDLDGRIKIVNLVKSQYAHLM